MHMAHWSFQGAGAFGNVHEAMVRSLEPGEAITRVAVKMLNEGAQEQDKRDFLAEIEVTFLCMHEFCTSSMI